MAKKTIFQKRPKSMVAINKKLWASCQAWAKRTYDVHPSAYSNSAAVKRYNKMGGKWRKPTEKMKKRAMSIKLDVKESDIMPPFSADEAQLLAERMGIDFEELDTTPDEFLKGLNVELEHRFLTSGDPSDTALIALDHLREDPQYYSKLLEMEGDKHDADPQEESVPASLDEEAQLIADFFGVAHHEAVDKLYDMLESGEQPESNIKVAKPLGGLGYWHKKEKWVDISRKDKSGKHPPCGRSDSSKGGKPRCRPASEAAKLSASEKKSETDKKRRTERSKKRKDKKPHMVKFDYMKKSDKKAEANMNFQKIAADLAGLATNIEARGNAQAAKAVDELTLRLLSFAEQLPAEVQKAAEPAYTGSKAAVPGVRLNDGHSITTYASVDELTSDLASKLVTEKQVVAAVADTLYSAGLADAQAELAATSNKLAAALRIAKSAGLLR